MLHVTFAKVGTIVETLLDDSISKEELEDVLFRKHQLHVCDALSSIS